MCAAYLAWFDRPLTLGIGRCWGAACGASIKDVYLDGLVMISLCPLTSIFAWDASKLHISRPPPVYASMAELYPSIAQCAVVATALKILLFPA